MRRFVGIPDCLRRSRLRIITTHCCFLSVKEDLQPQLSEYCFEPRQQKPRMDFKKYHSHGPSYLVGHKRLGLLSTAKQILQSLKVFNGCIETGKHFGGWKIPHHKLKLESQHQKHQKSIALNGIVQPSRANHPISRELTSQMQLRPIQPHRTQTFKAFTYVQNQSGYQQRFEARKYSLCAFRRTCPTTESKPSCLFVR